MLLTSATIGGYSLHEWTGDLPHVLFNLRLRAIAVSPGVTAIAARAGVGRSDQHEVRRKGLTNFMYRRTEAL